jgi:hypothetical protein
MSLRSLAILGLALLALAFPLSAQEGQGGPAFDCSGNWRLFLPAGFEHVITFRPEGKGRWRLTPAELVSSGIYEVQGDKLVLVEPKEARLRGFEFKITSEFLLTLTAEPGSGEPGRGSKYLGAVLFRNVDKLPLEPRAKQR